MSFLFKKRNAVATEEQDKDKDKDNQSKGKIAKINWKILKDTLGHISRDDMEEKLRANVDNPDLHIVIRLGHTILEESLGTAFKCQSSSNLFIGTVLCEWAIANGITINEEEELPLAKAHCEIWKGNAISADPYNLARSLELYEKLSKHFINAGNHVTMTDFSKVLQYAGMVDKAWEIFGKMLKVFEGRQEFPTYVYIDIIYIIYILPSSLSPQPSRDEIESSH